MDVAIESYEPGCSKACLNTWPFEPDSFMTVLPVGLRSTCTLWSASSLFLNSTTWPTRTKSTSGTNSLLYWSITAGPSGIGAGGTSTPSIITTAPGAAVPVTVAGPSDASSSGGVDVAGEVDPGCEALHATRTRNKRAELVEVWIRDEDCNIFTRDHNTGVRASQLARIAHTTPAPRSC